MAESTSNGLRWVAGLGGLLLLAVGIWFSAGGTPERSVVGGDDPAQQAPPAKLAPSSATPVLSSATPAPPSAALAPALRIAAHGRLTLDVDEFPDEGPVTLNLDLSDEARGGGDRTVRVISEDGRRIDTTVRPLSGGGSGVLLEIDPGFLSPGRYLIEVDTEEKHPLQLRRYVLEVR